MITATPLSENSEAVDVIDLACSWHPQPEVLLLSFHDKDDDQGCEGFEHVPILLDHFTVTVTGHGRDRRHLCFVQNLYSTSVSALRSSSPTNYLPVYMIRHLIYMVLQGLTALHSLNIIHTSEAIHKSNWLTLHFSDECMYLYWTSPFKPDNILIHNLDYSDEEKLTKFLADNPVETLENGLPKSQPIPHRWTYNNSAYETELISATLVDLGHGNF